MLAGGAGRRFDPDHPKQLARVGGRALIERALDVAGALDDVVLVLGARAQEILASIDAGDARVVVADDWEEGLSASLRAGVAAVPDAQRVVVLLADQPWVTRAAVLAVARAEPGGAEAVRARYDGTPGHPIALGPRLLARVPDLRGDVGARDLLAGAAVVEVDVAGSPADVDVPADLRRR
ncbi:MAG: nucleotidyltransferase family protein [Solirubrobacteraceae bacterium]